MTDITPTQQDRVLAELYHEALANEILVGFHEGSGCPVVIGNGSYEHASLLASHTAREVLTSDWLAEHVRAVAERSWSEGYDRACSDIDWTHPHGTRRITINPYLPTEGAERG